jgi:uncharacterized membrane protein YsdA (DUF1294 family)/cold shock CspA family protein
MRHVGRVTDWNDEKGFGFVTPNGGGDRAFVHVKAFEPQARRPVAGDLIAYTVQRDAKGRINAGAVRFAGARAARSKSTPGFHDTFPRKTVAAFVFAVLLAAALLHKLPIEVVFVYIIMSGVAIFLYAFDKSAAGRRQRRTPENTLHMVALLGGWPGALLAQGMFRHKSSKAAFQAVFWMTVLGNGGLLAWLLRSGAMQG